MNVFGLREMDRVHVFFDGPSIYAILKRRDVKIDYKKLHAYFESVSRYIRGSYFTTIRETDDSENDRIAKLLNFLELNGYEVCTRLAREFETTEGYRRIKGGMVSDITIAMTDAANRADSIILFTGDSDLVPAIDRCRSMGARVIIVSSDGTGITSGEFDDLQRSADKIVDVSDLPKEVLANFSTQSFAGKDA